MYKAQESPEKDNIPFESGRKRLTLFVIILAGESIFFLPFLLARVFRPTLLNVFGISNTELGLYFSVYGIIAMISYLFGGPLADRYASRKLMAIALWLTAAGGIFMALIPSSLIMALIYGFWGFTTICLFWAALIRATREWGGLDGQGRAFGWLEGGRGLTAALLGTLAFLFFSLLESGSNHDPAIAGSSTGGRLGFRAVILSAAAVTAAVGGLVWKLVPESKTRFSRLTTSQTLANVSRLMRYPSVWLLSLMIITAYSGYKVTDDFSLYAREVLGMSEVHSAGIGSAALWIRGVVAISAGYMADRFRGIHIIIAGYGFALTGGLLLGSGLLSVNFLPMIISLVFVMVGVYALRALYFAIMEDAGIPLKLTGTAVGMISFIGYTPEIFMGPLMGQLLDNNPGLPGHQYVFMLLAGVSLVGGIAAMVYRKSGSRIASG